MPRLATRDCLRRSLRRLAETVTELLQRQRIERADAGRGVVDFSGVSLGVDDHFLERIRRKFFARHHDARGFGGERNRNEIALRRHLQFGKEMRVDRDRADIAEEQRVAVRRRARRQLHADIAGGAGSVVDHQRLAERLFHRRLDQPDGEIGGAARGERHDDVDRPRRIVCGVLSRGGAVGGQQRQQNEHRVSPKGPRHALPPSQGVRPPLSFRPDRAAASAACHASPTNRVPWSASGCDALLPPSPPRSAGPLRCG